ncbi:MAG TPA: iron-containing redox enzyme family protein, partial [Kofleriaceae bacterium]
TRLMRMRLAPAVPRDDWREVMAEEMALHAMELDWIESERVRVAPIADRAPRDAARFSKWFDDLDLDGPGQHDPLWSWVANEATLSQLRWLLRQYLHGDGGTEDLLALVQARLPDVPKQALARGYVEELGRAPLFDRLAEDLALCAMPDDLVWEGRAIANLACGLAANRCYTYQAIGAIAVTALTSARRDRALNTALERLGCSATTRAYFTAPRTPWHTEAVVATIAERTEIAPFVAEGALLQLEAGARAYARFRDEAATVHARAA